MAETEHERKVSSPVNIPVETVLMNNEDGFYGYCQSMDSPKSYDAELFDSMAASKFLKEYINFNDEPQHTGTRSSKRQKEKNASKYKALSNQSHRHSRQKSQEHYDDFINQIDDEENQSKEPKKEMHKRKRSVERNRAIDRQIKEKSLVGDTIETNLVSFCEPLNFNSTNEKVVDTPDEFKSLNSKCIVGSPVRKMPDYGLDYECSFPYSSIYQNSVKSSSLLETDRCEFHQTFSLLLKAGCKDVSEIFLRQKSQEEIIWQNSLMDLIWLEIQAWQNGITMKEQDALLCSARAKIPEVLKKVIDFKFDSGFESMCCKPQGSLSFVNLKETFSSCSIFCERYMEQVSRAYDEIANLLQEVQRIEQLYPSMKCLSTDQQLYNDEIFNTKYKTLSLWYNIISDIKIKLTFISNLIQIKYSLKFLTSNNECDNGTVREHRDSGVGSSATPSPSILPRSGSISSLSSEDMYFYENQENLTPKYHCFVEKKLREKGGLRKMMEKSQHLLDETICHIYAALQPFEATETYASVLIKSTDAGNTAHGISAKDCNFLWAYKHLGDGIVMNCNPDNAKELNRYGSTSETFKEMALPSFLPFYLHLINTVKNVMEQCIQIRLDQQPKNPSLLSIQQLVIELQEVIRAGLVVRYWFINLMKVVYDLGIVSSNSTSMKTTRNELLDMELATYDDNLSKILQVYLYYIQRQMQLSQCLVDSSVSKLILEKDWAFMKRYSGQIRGGKTLAATQFCFFTRDLLESIADCVERSVDDCNTNLCDALIAESNASTSRQNILTVIREYRKVISYIRERSLRVMSFAKMLRKDLEIAAEYQLKDQSCKSWAKFFNMLHETNHIKVLAPHCEHYMLFIPHTIKENFNLRWQLLDNISGYNYDLNQQSCSEIADNSGYLLLIRYNDDCENMFVWNGPTVQMEHTAESAITLSHVELEGMLIVVNHSSQLGKQCAIFKSIVGDSVILKESNTSCNIAIAEALHEVKVQALDLRSKVSTAIQEVQNRFEFAEIGEIDGNDFSNIKSFCKEILIQGYTFGFEFHRDIIWLVTCNSQEVSNVLFSFAQMWMDFVMAWVPRGRGFKPIWAAQGLEFLSLISNPRFTVHLADDEFRALKSQINDVVLHVIGSRSGSPAITASNSSTSLRSISLRFSGTDFDKFMPQSPSFQDSNVLINRTISDLSSHSEPDGREQRMKNTDMPPVRRIRKAISMIEETREKFLAKQNKIGHVCDISSRKKKFIARKVTFSWQRGKKLGEGRFGKVYTAVNNSNGELIAMKEIAIPHGDHKAIKDVTDEIYIFERLHHKHLVRYYGVEVHREEMYIFMELCNEGTLEYACQLGLVESTIRKYSQQLLIAISVLHKQKIVHRDIKTANIFLTSDGDLKLGDFGCCIKLKGFQTTPGELAAFVGTPAYMAPEVITQSGSKGHGRAADMWSFGCVVIEMFSGKRPWHDLENSQQIMFKVGMGGTPEIPPNIGEEGMDFINKCLVHDPSERANASSLLMHPFTKYVLTRDD